MRTQDEPQNGNGLRSLNPVRLRPFRAQPTVLDAPPDGAFDRITALAARFFRVPIAITSIVDADQIWFKSSDGLEMEDIDRDPSLCVPLTTSDGFNLGTFCLMDRESRRLTGEETATLVDMAAIATNELELRLTSRRLAAAEVARELETAADHWVALQATSLQALISAVDARDRRTAKHSATVVQLARLVAEAQRLPAAQVSEIAQVGLLHDVGKIGIADDILQKPGPLDEGEWARMHEHPAIGEKIVASLTELAHLAPAIRAGHERWDGGGYPDGLKAEAIPIASRIVFACDACDAMTTDRPYRSAMSPSAARAELRAHSGTQFEPKIIDCLIAILDVRRGGSHGREASDVASTT